MPMANNGLFTRRSLLVGGASSIALPTVLLSTPKAEGMQNKTILEKNDRKLTFLTAQDQEFSSSLDSHFPGLSSDPSFEKLLPLAILVKNEYGPAVRAYSITWSAQHENDSYEAPLFRYGHLDKKRKRGVYGKHHKARTRLSFQNDMMRQGHVKLVTPFFTLSPKRYKAAPTKWYKKVKAKEPAGFLISQSLKGATININLDGALFSDQKVLGPDKHRLAHRVISMRNGEHDEALSLLKHLRAGGDYGDLRDILEKHSSADIPRKKTRAKWYALSRKRYATFLLYKYGDFSRKRFIKTLEWSAKRKKLSITKL